LNEITILEVAGAGAAAAILGYSTFYEQFALRVRELELAFANLPEAFDGYTILHICDMHLTKLGLLEKRLMELISAREVDTCVVTGDVTAEPRASDIFRRVCSVIRHRDPIYMILGNSEHKPWLDTEMLINALSFDGLRMIINSSTTIERGGQRIVLAGVDDAYSRLADVDAAFSGVDPKEFIIFLTHCPSTAPEGVERGADLVLSGHTHGGQFRLPGAKWFWTHMRSNRALNDGLYLPNDLKRICRKDTGNSVLFVNRGVGTSRIHVRFLCPPEIAYITLRRARFPARQNRDVITT